jgi:tRNA(Ile)-lysidine synthetase-like protein
VQRFRNQSVRLRPLLNFERSEIRDALSFANITWREDASNESEVYYRNFLRKKIIPLWESASPSSLKHGVSLARELLEEDEFALEAWVDRLNLSFEEGEDLELGILRKQPNAIIRRALHRFLMANDKSGILSHSAFEDLLEAVKSKAKKSFSLGKDSYLRIEGDVLRLEYSEADSDWEPCHLIPCIKLYLPDGFCLEAEWIELSDALIREIRDGVFDNIKVAYLAVDEADSPYLIVRLWMNGDRYRPLGSKGMRKLQDIFVDKKISRKVRRRLPIITTAGGDIVWSPSLPPAENVKITTNTRKALRLTYTKVL